MSAPALDLERLEGALAGLRFGHPLVYRSSLPSTNDLGLELLDQGRPEGTLVLGETQTRGRGRQGRYWHSPPGLGLYLSLLLRPVLPPEALPLLTFTAAVAVCRCLSSLLSESVQIKWPNDIYLKGRKLAGLLAEVRGAPHEARAVVGLGMNVNHSLSDFPEELASQATSLRLISGITWDRRKLLRNLLQTWEEEHRILTREGPATILSRWEPYSLFQVGARIRVEMDRETKTGTYQGIGPLGELRLRGEAGQTLRLMFGDAHQVRERKPCSS